MFDVRRLAMSLLLGFGVMIASARGASADGATDSYVSAVPGDSGTVTVGAGYSSTSNAPTGQGASSSSLHCTSITLDPAGAALMGPGPGGSTDGSWVLPNCAGGGYINPMRPVWVPNSSGQARPSSAVVARQAVTQLSLPQGLIRMSPDATQPQMVNERTWLWVDPAVWHAVSATASVGIVSATATATPSQVIWNLGDGDGVTCNGPGAPYDAAKGASQQDTSCTYVWPRGSAAQQGGTFTVSTTIVWRVTWSAIGAPGGGSLGTLNSPPSEVAVQVTESDALNTAT